MPKSDSLTESTPLRVHAHHSADVLCGSVHSSFVTPDQFQANSFIVKCMGIIVIYNGVEAVKGQATGQESSLQYM